MVHIWGFLESISGPPGWVDKWSTFFLHIKWFQRILVNLVFKEGCRVFVAFWCSGPKQAFQKGDDSHPPFPFFCSDGWLLALDDKKGVAKKP